MNITIKYMRNVCLVMSTLFYLMGLLLKLIDVIYNYLGI